MRRYRSSVSFPKNGVSWTQLMAGTAAFTLGTLCAGLTAMPGVALASNGPTTWYVNSSTGSDTTTTGNSASGTPLKTIQAAINAASVGDTIDVEQGTYNVSTSITVSKQLTIEGTGSPTVTSTSETILGVFRLSSAASNTTIEGLTIKGGADGIYVNSGANDVTINDNSISAIDANDYDTGSGAAINVVGNSRTVISGLKITGNRTIGGTGIALFNTSGAVISDNTVTGAAVSGSVGIYVGGGDSDTTITGNYVSSCDGAIRIDYALGAGPNSDISITLNSFDSSDYSAEGAIVVPTPGAYTNSSRNPVTLDAPDNWWGCSAGPGATGCTYAGNGISTSAWLTGLTLTPSSTTAQTGTPVHVSVTPKVSSGAVPMTFPVTFSLGSGTAATLTSSGDSATVSDGTAESVTVTAEFGSNLPASPARPLLTGTTTINFTS